MAGDSTSPKLQFRSDLAQMPLPEVLATIHRHKAPGVIECTRAGHTKSIFIDFGNIIFAASTDVRDSLGDRLLAQGRITEAQYEESVRRLREGSRRQGVILVDMRALEPKELFVAVREQVQAIVWSIFEWTDGSVSFQPGRERSHEFIKLNIPTRQAVIQGVRLMTDPRLLLARIGTRTTVVQVRKDADFSDISLLPEEQALLDAVDGRTTLYELTNRPPRPAVENAKTLYALYALRIIQVKPSGHVKVQMRVR